MNEELAQAPEPPGPPPGHPRPIAPNANPAPPFPAPRWEVFSWCMFDFANSSFTTVVVTVVFSVYFTKIVCGEGPDANFHWNLGMAISQIVVLLTAPILGAIADYSGRKKRFLALSWLGCCLFTASLWFVQPGYVLLGLLLFIPANIAFSVGENLTAAFLPELAKPEHMGRVSGFGWAWGYVGGLSCLFLCWTQISAGYTLQNVDGLRATMLIVAAFFLVAGLPTMLFLRERAVPQSLPQGKGYVGVAFGQVWRTLRNVRQFRVLAFFLIVFFAYNCGIVIVVGNAAIFAEKEMDFSGQEVALLFILLQITSALGAFAFGFVQDRWGARKTIQIALLLWTVVVLGCSFAKAKPLFWVLGNLAGLAIGSSQSAARALVGVFSPRQWSAEFFGFWGLCAKLSAVVGPFVFGLADRLSGSMRTAIGITTAFFVLGILGMLFVNERAGRQAAFEAEQAATPGNA